MWGYHLEPCAEDHVQAASEGPQGGRLPPALWETCASARSPLHCEEVFADAEVEPPVFQSVPIASAAVTGHH